MIGPNQIVCLPGTQTSLYAVMLTLVGPGDEVLVGDPMYATYEGVIASTGARMVPVPVAGGAWLSHAGRRCGSGGDRQDKAVAAEHAAQSDGGRADTG